jgi:MFS transporter, BCD family, chlorophyll transporter
MNLTHGDETGMSLGAWGATQASAAGLAIASGGLISDFVSGLGARGLLGPVLTTPATGYVAVYMIEIVMLFVTLAALGPLVRPAYEKQRQSAEDIPLNPLPVLETANGGLR